MVLWSLVATRITTVLVFACVDDVYDVYDDVGDACYDRGTTLRVHRNCDRRTHFSTEELPNRVGCSACFFQYPSLRYLARDIVCRNLLAMFPIHCGWLGYIIELLKKGALKHLDSTSTVPRVRGI